MPFQSRYRLETSHDDIERAAFALFAEHGTLCPERRLLQEIASLFEGSEQRLHLAPDGFIAAARFLQKSRTIRLRRVQTRVQDVFDLVPALWCEAFRHG